MTIQHLRYVLTVAGCGSMTEASKRLYISQPSLSEAIRNIEREAGITIFNRSRAGITLTKEGVEFISYAEQVVQQMDLMEAKYGEGRPKKKRFCVSTHHYAFSADAFADTACQFDDGNYEFILNETETYQIMQDVKSRFSEIGVLFLSDSNAKVIHNHLRKLDLEFHQLHVRSPFVFLGENHPLAGSESISFRDLEDYPRITFLQTHRTTADFDEELFSDIPVAKEIKVSDRMAKEEIILRMNAYEICSGIFPRYLRRDEIISVPLKEGERMRIGYITRMDQKLTKMGSTFVALLNEYLKQRREETGDVRE